MVVCETTGMVSGTHRCSETCDGHSSAGYSTRRTSVCWSVILGYKLGASRLLWRSIQIILGVFSCPILVTVYDSDPIRRPPQPITVTVTVIIIYSLEGPFPRSKEDSECFGRRRVEVASWRRAERGGTTREDIWGRRSTLSQRGVGSGRVETRKRT